tara:strand:- start:3553 stop:3855 length:303 start_codon:yes stop_codon:yes gene_type:complete
MEKDKKKDNLKLFFIKLAAITLSIIIIINVTYNLIFAENLKTINKIISFDKNTSEEVKDKVRLEIKKGLAKDKILNKEDAELLYKFYIKVKKEIDEVKSN